MQHYSFIGAKGGVGTSTAALSFAAGWKGVRVLVTSQDPSNLGDLCSLAGAPNIDIDYADRREIAVGAWVGVPELLDHIDGPHFDVVVWDGPAPVDCEQTFHVARNDYLSMRRLCRIRDDVSTIVMVREERRALDEHDLRAVIGDHVEVVVWPHLDSIARAADAGLLMSSNAARFPKGFSHA